MLKNFLSVILLAVAMLFVGSNPVSAKDVYIESDYGGRRDIYIVTESINKREANTVKVTLKFIKNGKLDYTEHRIYAKPEGDMWWMSSEEANREGLRPTRVWEPQEDKILQYCLRY